MAAHRPCYSIRNEMWTCIADGIGWQDAFVLFRAAGRLHQHEQEQFRRLYLAMARMP